MKHVYFQISFSPKIFVLQKKLKLIENVYLKQALTEKQYIFCKSVEIGLRLQACHLLSVSWYKLIWQCGKFSEKKTIFFENRYE